MELLKLSYDNVKNLSDKEIICIEYSLSYLEEIEEKYHICNKIVGFIDDNKRKQGVVVINNKEIKVVGSDELENMDLEGKEVLITSDYYWEAYDMLCTIAGIQSQLKSIYYFVNKENEIEYAYRKKYETSNLEDMILFRSGPHKGSYIKGMDFVDNARALFEHMLNEGYNKKYKLVWMVKNPEQYKEYQKHKNVSFISDDWALEENLEQRDEYYRVLCLSKYIFFTDAYGFARNARKDQIRVQLWHGCGFKTRINFARCEKRYEYTTVTSDVYADIHSDIFGLRKEQVLVTGCAKGDWIYHPISDDRIKDIGIKEDRKIIFWLPTYRLTRENISFSKETSKNNQTGLPMIDTLEEMKELDNLLEVNNMQMIIKFHPFQDISGIKIEGLSNIMLLTNERLYEKDIQINQLIGHADALISDYSSVAVDYLLLNRPIAFTLDDVSEYSERRGFIFDDILNWLPGKEIYDKESFFEYVREIGNDVDSTKDKREGLRERLHNFCDDGSCDRILEQLGIRRLVYD